MAFPFPHPSPLHSARRRNVPFLVPDEPSDGMCGASARIAVQRLVLIPNSHLTTIARLIRVPRRSAVSFLDLDGNFN